MFHFDWSISLGQIVTLLGLAGVFIRLNRVITFFSIEHEYLMKDYAERKRMKLEELPTRQAKKRPTILGI